MNNKKKDKDKLSEALRENLKRRRMQLKNRMKTNLVKHEDKNIEQDLEKK